MHDFLLIGDLSVFSPRYKIYYTLGYILEHWLPKAAVSKGAYILLTLIVYFIEVSIFSYDAFIRNNLNLDLNFLNSAFLFTAMYRFGQIMSILGKDMGWADNSDLIIIVDVDMNIISKYSQYHFISWSTSFRRGLFLLTQNQLKHL